YRDCVDISRHMDVIIRRMNPELYRRLKARAPLLGYRVTDAVQEAINLWLREAERPVETELDADNREYERMKPSLLPKHRGRYAGFHSGRFAGVADTR
ncbi:MAG: hypothetical protein NZ938_03095, partial [Aigarchaeota archaeon]|nr:hypothetical protein [Candidatus Calditenuaceae archaeon]